MGLLECTIAGYVDVIHVTRGCSTRIKRPLMRMCDERDRLRYGQRRAHLAMLRIAEAARARERRTIAAGTVTLDGLKRLQGGELNGPFLGYGGQPSY